MKGMPQDIWRYRYFIFTSIKTELRSKFIRSKLGGAWMILNPLANVLIFAFVLADVMKARLPGIDSGYAYVIYLMAGTLAWSLFAEILNRCVNIFVENGNILKKLMFPKVALPLIVTGSALVNNILLLAAILMIFGALGHTPGTAVISLFVLMVINVALALGIGLTLGVLNVFIRDIGQVVPVVMQLMFWVTPIVYMASIIPPKFKFLLAFNPMTPIVTGYQNVLLYNRQPDWSLLSVVAVIAFISLGLALLLYRKAGTEMVDQL